MNAIHLNATHALAVPFPSEWMSWHRLVFPKSRQWRAALPYALEERLASDVQQLKLIPVREGTSSEGWVVAIAQQDWQTFAEQSAQTAAAWYPDFMRLPWQADQVTLLCESEQRWLVRWGEWEGTAGQPATMLTLLQTLPASQRQTLVRYGDAAIESLPSEWNIKRLPLSALPVVQPSFDLRQGAGKRQWQWSGLGAWKTPALLLAGVLVMTALVSLTNTLQQSRATEGLQQQTQALVKSHFPEIKRQVNILAQAKSVLKERQSLQTQLQSSPLLALQQLDATLVNFPPVSQLQLSDKGMVLTWITPLTEAQLSQVVVLPGWQGSWRGTQQLSLVKQGETP